MVAGSNKARAPQNKLLRRMWLCIYIIQSYLRKLPIDTLISVTICQPNFK
ncbi:hypothetical protein HanXRQr2_Chr16g0776061 [Helianthus annuus]|uniref:Uncharacterized protein n=1 Tax=Helianthus annuus TaxID=4232 RepID=A0A9K3DVK6_HELAN|nr:hypothetical protein HanXRQr2_Chr16g0776061 [Helianthus annuus]KAJ0823504.1 hypothetical protein HanPSC8_Chr16g0744491 [Helianthus annuus]